MHKSNKTVTGRDVATCASQIAFAKSLGINHYDKRTIMKLEAMFVNDDLDGSEHTISDLLKIFESFIQIDEFENKESFLKHIPQHVLSSIKNNSRDMLTLYQKLDEHGILEKDEDNKLLIYFQNSLEEKFDYTDKDELFFDHCDFLKKMGLWYWNTALIS